ncbi:MAG TPA: ribose 5-phosphate isomerase A, partial [Candidatus Dormibacteraeota bacterium]|nr:ribose 5-phosphate isomerase A [Candidatus Dormibacteraeota bacterium]
MEPKQAAALRALEEVHEGMLLGLGTGTTAAYFIDALGERVRDGLRITAVATSDASA